MRKYKQLLMSYEAQLEQAKKTGQPVITATQVKKTEISTAEIFESLKNCKACDIVIRVSKDRNPGPTTVPVLYNGDGFIKSLFKNKQ